MVQLLVVKNKWRGILQKCFETDNELIEKYHIIAGAGIEKCVDKTLEDLLSCEKLDFYVLKNSKKIVGYFAIEAYKEGKHLTGFFIMPEYRKKEIVKEFWKMVHNNTSDIFLCGIYKKNEAARKFLEKEMILNKEFTHNNKLLIFKSK